MNLEKHNTEKRYTGQQRNNTKPKVEANSENGLADTDTTSRKNLEQKGFQVEKLHHPFIFFSFLFIFHSFSFYLFSFPFMIIRFLLFPMFFFSFPIDSFAFLLTFFISFSLVSRHYFSFSFHFPFMFLSFSFIVLLFSFRFPFVFFSCPFV